MQEAPDLYTVPTPHNGRAPATGATSRLVNSHTEWDPLEEVIVGVLDGAMFLAHEELNRPTVEPGEWETIVQRVTGKHQAPYPYPPEVIEAGQRDLAEFVHILQAEGVTIRRPDMVNHARAYVTPAWHMAHGFCAANPRDPFLVIGNEILETPMADRGRYFEAWAYRSLFKEYFKAGAKWTAAPKPQLLDELYDETCHGSHENESGRFVITEFEPVFDAADVMRCGRDLFIQKSHVTNDLGILWLRRHLGDSYRVHVIENRDPCAIHIDTTFIPLAPGKVLVNPEYVNVATLPDILKTWEILIAPQPVVANNWSGAVSPWISINVMMLDQERVIVEKSQEPLIKAFKEWGFTPIVCPFEQYYPFFGSFHCATLDIRRRGELQTYF